MDATTAIDKLSKQLEAIPILESKPRFSEEFTKWKRDTLVLLNNVWKSNPKYSSEFNAISYVFKGIRVLDGNPRPDNRAFLGGLSNAKALLKSMIDEIQEYGLEQADTGESGNVLQHILLICDRFHLVARQIRSRHENRTTIDIEDEYDVQDLFHSLLTLYFDDVRSEEWTPSYAGKCSRMDFLLKDIQTVVEIKKTRKGLTNKEIGDQLIIDKERYRIHPDCRRLVCFVYDPEGKIANPRGIESDFSDESDSFSILVLIGVVD